MRSVAAALLLLAAVSLSAQAEGWPAVHSNVNTGREAIAAVAHVPTNAALAAAATASYPNGVWRDDYAAGNRAPPLWFMPQSGTCVASGLANDGGTCTDGAGGNSWRASNAGDIDARQFGAVSDAIAATGITTTAGGTAFGGIAIPSRYGGKSIIVPGAGAGGFPLVTTLSADATAFVDAAANAVPATWFAAPGSDCAIVAPGAGYIATDTITLDAAGGAVPTVCQVQFTQAVNAALVSAGSGCPTLNDVRGYGAFGYGTPVEVKVDFVGGIATNLRVTHGGRYTAVQPGMQTDLDFSQSGHSCSGTQPRLSYQLGVGLARVVTPGVYAGAPATPLAQTATTGAGVGATLSPSYTQSGAMSYGTDNRAALASIMARTSAPTIRVPSGAYLLSCGATINAASSVSLAGDGIAKTVLRMFPYCGQAANTPILDWDDKDGSGQTGITLDLNRAYVTADNGRSTNTAIRMRGSDHFTFERNSIEGGIQLWRLLGIVSLEQGIKDLRVKDNYFEIVAPDTMVTQSVTISNNGATPGSGGDIKHSWVTDNLSVGTGMQICVRDSIVTGNIASAWHFGAGLYIPPERVDQPNCRDNLVAINLSHDGAPDSRDVNLTPAHGFELHNKSNSIIGNLAYRNGGVGFAMVGSDHSILADVAYDNGRRAGETEVAGFALAANPFEGGDNMSFLGNRAFDTDTGSQRFGYIEYGLSLTNMGLGPNDFTGPLGPASTVGATTHPIVTLGPTLFGGQSSAAVPAMAGKPGEVGLVKTASPSGVAPGAGAGKFALVPGTSVGTCKLIFYAGTSASAVTLQDNIGAGC